MLGSPNIDDYYSWTQSYKEMKRTRYPIDKSRKAGANPRKIDVNLDNRQGAENKGRIIEKPVRGNKC